MSYEPENEQSGEGEAADRTNLPGVFLMIVGLLNVLGGFVPLFIAYIALANPEAIMQQQRVGPFANQKMTPEDAKMAGIIYLVAGAVALTSSLITVLAGWRMRSLQSYGLAIVGAVLAALPCISPLGCCGVGEIVGIWALVVLLNSDVKAAFQQAPTGD